MAVAFNTGICRREDTDGAAPGMLICPYKIINPVTARAFYPDMLYRHPFSECTLTEKPAADFFQSAVKTLPPHRVITVKMVSAGDENLNRKRFASLYESVLAPWFFDLREKLARENAALSDVILDENEKHLLRVICDNLRLTYAMRAEIIKKALAFKITGGDIKAAVLPYISLTANNKQEGKGTYARVIRAFVE